MIAVKFFHTTIKIISANKEFSQDNHSVEVEVGCIPGRGYTHTIVVRITPDMLVVDDNVNCIVETCSSAYLVPDPAATTDL